MHSPVRLALSALALVTLLLPSIAYADDEAESLYRDGKKAAQAKDWPTACAKFKASADREPAPGTWLNLGDCEEHRGRLRDARASFESSVRMFKAGDERGNYARQRLAAIDRKIPKLTAKLPTGSPADSRSELDGAPLTSKEPVALEPGEHVLVVHASGRSNVESRITLAEGENRSIVLNVGSRTTTDGPVGTTKVTSATMMTPPPKPEGSGLRTTGWIVLGVGAAGVATGLFAGLMTMNAKSDADKNCPNDACNPDGLAAQSSGTTWSTISTTAFIAGGVAAVSGISLVLLSGPKATVGINPTGVTYQAQF